MKSSYKITFAAIGLLSTVVFSAVAFPASKKIVPVDNLIDDQMEFDSAFEEIALNDSEMENDFELLELKGDNKVVDSKAEVISSQSSYVPKIQSSSVKTTSVISTSSKVTSLNPNFDNTSSSTASSGPTQTPVVRENGTVSKKYSDANGELLRIEYGDGYVDLPVKVALKKMVSNEMDANLSYEALKAQAVAAHTYVKYYNDQGIAIGVGMRSSYVEGGKIDKAVEEVYNQVMTYNGKAIYSPYHASAAGRTQSSKEVWGGARAYLVSVESKYDYLADYYNLSKHTYSKTPIKSNYLVKKTISAETVKSKIQDKLGVTPNSDPTTWFKFLDAEHGGYTSGGYVNKIVVAGKTTTGVKVRSIFGLRSSFFDISYSDGNFVFTTKGYGHGVGLSQWGAHFYADKEGWDYKQILSHYYTGISISTVV